MNGEQLGQLLKGLGEAVRDTGRKVDNLVEKVGHLETECAVTNRDVKTLSTRVGNVEKWQDDKDDKAEATGAHEKNEALIKAAELQKKIDRDAADKRKQWFDITGKALILVLGAVIALLMARYGVTWPPH